MLTQRRQTNVLAKKNKQTNTLTPTHLQSQIRKANVQNVATLGEQWRGERGRGIRCKVRAELPFGLHKFHYPKRREAATILS